MGETSVVECQDVSKAYRKGAWALERCNFGAAPGRCTAIIGANGAGKTTLLNILLGTVRADRGQVFWFGNPLDRCLPLLYDQVAFVPEEHTYYGRWSGNQLISFVRSFHKQWQAECEEALRQHLKIPLSEPTKTYSKGNRTKLSLLLALCQGASVFVMDEPFSGLDPMIREELLALISQQVRRLGRTLILTSHDLFAVEFLADDLVVIHDGKFLFSGRLEDFIASYRSVWLSDEKVVEVLRGEGMFVRERREDGVVRFAVVGARSKLATLDLQCEHSEREVTLQDAYSACVSAHCARRNE